MRTHSGGSNGERKDRESGGPTDEFGTGTPLVNSGIMTMKNCLVISTHSYCLLANGITDVSDSTFVNPGGMCVFFNDEVDSNGSPRFNFSGNKFVYSHVFDSPFWIDGEFADSSAFEKKLERDNTTSTDVSQYPSKGPYEIEMARHGNMHSYGYGDY